MSTRTPSWGSFAWVSAISLAAGAVAGAASAFLNDVDGVAGSAAVVGVVTVALGVAIYACLSWWRRLDEAAREAHKWAWFWGGSAGMAAGFTVLITLYFRSDDAAMGPLADMPVAEALYAGALFIVLSQAIGYAVAWTVWWLRHR